jgi:hypothetical protein
MGSPDTRDEAVYDAYLAASAVGAAESPDAVFARHPGLGAEVRSRIEALWLATSLRGVGTPAPRELDRLGPYRLLERLDSGGMGTVFRAERDPDGAPFAVKVLRPELSGSATAAERLRREALALAKVRHPSVVRVHGFGEDRGVWYLVLDLVPGRGLDEVLAEASSKGERLDAARVVRWGTALARGLQAAHDAGVIHRDVKPSNVLLRPDDTPLLLDFGIATVPDRTPGVLTTSFAGSPFYAAPEQITGAAADGRADVYGLCATLHECLTGVVPFGGDRFETVMRRVLLESPVPVRRLVPGLPAALETVLLAGLEKDPARRPASAAALADDLEAAMAGGRVRARRPGPVRRLVRWSRARPWAAVGVFLFAAASVGTPVTLEVSRRNAAERTRGEARAAVDEAWVIAGALVSSGKRVRELSHELYVAQTTFAQEWIPDSELELLADREQRLDVLRRDRDGALHRGLALLDRADRLAPGLEGIAPARAALYLQRWKEAADAGDSTAAEVYRGLVARSDPGGAAEREMEGTTAVRIVPHPSDAEVHLFRVVLRSEILPGGGQRLVPVPLRGPPEGIPPAPWALRVVDGAGGVAGGDHVLAIAGHGIEGCVLAATAKPPLRNLDRLLSVGGIPVRDVADARRLGAEGPERLFAFEREGARVEVPGASLAALGVSPVAPVDAARAGGVPATLWMDGKRVEAALPAGLGLRVTAAPLLPGPRSLVARGDTGWLRLPPGDYAILLRREGLLDTREYVALRKPGAGTTLEARMPEPRERPPGCVRAVIWPGFALRPETDACWIRERETTAGEYLEFLNDPETLRAVDAAARPILVPRHEVDPPLWPRGTDGRFSLPRGTEADHPVLGVSFDDAVAYARWLSARAAERGEPWTWRLPTRREWTHAAGGATSRAYVFGPRFHPRWASSCHSRPAPAPEPVGSYPIDESPYGVFDACGSAMEWIDDWYDEPRGLRRIGGGSWAQGLQAAFLIHAPRGARPDRADREFGFRLVAEPREGTPK